MESFIIGIAGGTGSGKTTLTKRLKERFGDDVSVISHDNYYKRHDELLELGLSVPQVTKIFLKLREMGVDVPADVYTIPYAVKTLLEAKRRRDAGESLVLPRSTARKGGAV